MPSLLDRIGNRIGAALALPTMNNLRGALEEIGEELRSTDRNRRARPAAPLVWMVAAAIAAAKSLMLWQWSTRAEWRARRRNPELWKKVAAARRAKTKPPGLAGQDG
jgi:hypothetical protein